MVAGDEQHAGTERKKNAVHKWVKKPKGMTSSANNGAHLRFSKKSRYRGSGAGRALRHYLTDRQKGGEEAYTGWETSFSMHASKKLYLSFQLGN